MPMETPATSFGAWFSAESCAKDPLTSCRQAVRIVHSSHSGCRQAIRTHARSQHTMACPFPVNVRETTVTALSPSHFTFSAKRDISLPIPGLFVDFTMGKHWSPFPMISCLLAAKLGPNRFAAVGSCATASCTSKLPWSRCFTSSPLRCGRDIHRSADRAALPTALRTTGRLPVRPPGASAAALQ